MGFGQGKTAKWVTDVFLIIVIWAITSITHFAVVFPGQIPFITTLHIQVGLTTVIDLIHAIAIPVL